MTREDVHALVDAMGDWAYGKLLEATSPREGRALLKSALCANLHKVTGPQHDPTPKRYPDAPGYSNGSTSKAAARSMEGKPATDGERKVMAALRIASATCEEVENRLGLSHQTCSARIRYLALKGLIVDTGQTRTNRSGRQAIVWRLA